MVSLQGTSLIQKNLQVRNNPTSCAEVVEITTYEQIEALVAGNEETMEKLQTNE